VTGQREPSPPDEVAASFDFGFFQFSSELLLPTYLLEKVEEAPPGESFLLLELSPDFEGESILQSAPSLVTNRIDFLHQP